MLEALIVSFMVMSTILVCIAFFVVFWETKVAQQILPKDIIPLYQPIILGQGLIATTRQWRAEIGPVRVAEWALIDEGSPVLGCPSPRWAHLHLVIKNKDQQSEPDSQEKEMLA